MERGFPRIRLKSVLFAFAFLALPQALYAQLDVTDKNYLKSVTYYLTADTGQADSTANLVITFKKEAGRYQHILMKDTLFLEFYDAFFDPNTVKDKVGPPFLDLKLLALQENLRPIEDISQTMMEVVRIALPVRKGMDAKVSASHVRQVVAVDLKWTKTGRSASEEKAESSSIWPYVVGGAVAIAAVSGIVYLIENTSRQKTDQIVEK